MLILGLDTETNHYDPAHAKVTEFGAVLWDTDLGQPVEIYSDLVKEVGLGPLPPEIVEITGITDDMIERFGKSPFKVISKFLTLYAQADYVMAHNGNGFDRPLVRNFMGRYLTEGEAKLITPKHWLDSLTDVDYPKLCSHKSMTYLQGFYKIVNPFPHRAVTDVLTMLTIAQTHWDWNDIILMSHSPTLRFIAEVDYHNRDVAKDAGFKFMNEPSIGRKHWYKDMKKLIVDRKEITYDFKHGAVLLENNEYKCAKGLVNRCLCNGCKLERTEKLLQEAREAKAARLIQ
jgi:DNA polymerase-3 subunit epsilon